MVPVRMQLETQSSKLPTVVLLVYTSVGIIHMAQTFVSGFSLSSWDTAREVVALAPTSKPPEDGLTNPGRREWESACSRY